MPTREQSRELLHKHIQNENLRKHSEMVALAMEAYAKEIGKDESEIEEWWTTGLLHDLDWEDYPDEHPAKAIAEFLPEAGYDQKIIDGVAAHAPDRTGKQPETEMERYIYATDELSGFLNACSLVRPTGFGGMKVKSVKKRLKSNGFAAGVNREDITKGAELIDKPIEEHIQFLISVFEKEYAQ